jgi:hypothetical protein
MAEHLKAKDMTMLKWSLTKNNLENLITKLRLLDWTKSWRVTVVEAKANRSLEQNERLWELYTSVGNHLGLDKQQVHELMSWRLLRSQSEIAGFPVELIKSTTKLTTAEMTDCQQQIELWANTMGWSWDL